jgi:hypothetical protein
MTDATTVRSRRSRRGAIAGFALAACIGCCSIPFLAGLTIFGVALCSTKFLGVAFGAVFTVAATVALVAYRKRKPRGNVGPSPVELGVRRDRVDEPS